MGVHLRSGPPPQRVGKISQFVIDSLSMTEGDARKSKEKSQFHLHYLFNLLILLRLWLIEMKRRL